MLRQQHHHHLQPLQPLQTQRLRLRLPKHLLRRLRRPLPAPLLRPQHCRWLRLPLLTQPNPPLLQRRMMLLQ
jgi:hypothetical protein